MWNFFWSFCLRVGFWYQCFGTPWVIFTTAILVKLHKTSHWRDHIEVSSSELYSYLSTQNNTTRKTRGISPWPLDQHHNLMFRSLKIHCRCPLKLLQTLFDKFCGLPQVFAVRHSAGQRVNDGSRLFYKPSQVTQEKARSKLSVALETSNVSLGEVFSK